MTRRVVLAVSFGVLFSTISLLAHHSAASAYDTDKKITLHGTVTKVEWKNPHVFYYLDVADASGKRDQLVRRSVDAQSALSKWVEEGRPEDWRGGHGDQLVPRQKRVAQSVWRHVDAGGWAQGLQRIRSHRPVSADLLRKRRRLLVFRTLDALHRVGQ